jgi:hypothetical protein
VGSQTQVVPLTNLLHHIPNQSINQSINQSTIQASALALLAEQLADVRGDGTAASVAIKVRSDSTNQTH